MSYQVGDILGKYTIRGEIGRGQFGSVYFVEWLGSKGIRRGALKILIKDQTIKSILDEVSTWARVSHHANILTFIGATEHNRQILLISEYARGGSLDDWIKQHAGKKETVDDAIRLMLGILGGLQHLHENEIVHRDIKPANILLNDNDPLLADFGLARGLDLAQSSILGGTILYMSPELVDAFLSQSSRTEKYERTEADDLWAAAVTFYEMIAGDVPFKSINEIVSSRPSALPTHISPRLSEFMTIALTKQTSRRFQTAQEMCAALDAVRVQLHQDSLVATISSEDWLEGQRRKAHIDAEFATLDLMSAADFARAAELDEAGAYFNRGLLFANQEKYLEAIKDWNKAIRLYPQFVAAYNNRGLANFYIGKLDEAFADYAKTIELDPRYTVAYSNRAIAHERNGDYTEAICDYGQAIELDPRDPIAYGKRASAYERIGELEKARLDRRMCDQLSSMVSESDE